MHSSLSPATGMQEKKTQARQTCPPVPLFSVAGVIYGNIGLKISFGKNRMETEHHNTKWGTAYSLMDAIDVMMINATNGCD